MLAGARQLLARVRELFAGKRIAAERDEEFRFHLEMEVEHNRRAGMSDADARRAATIAFGGQQRFRDETRDVRGFVTIDNIERDMRFALRRIRRAPGFAAGAIATLGIGIGAAVGIGTMVHGVLLRDLPYKNPESLVHVSFLTPGLDVAGDLHSGASYRHFAASSKSFVELGAYYTNDQINLSDGDAAERVTAGMVTPGTFRMLGVVPLLGSLFTVGDTAWSVSGGVLISEDLWTRRYGRDREIIGKRIEINRGVRQVLGVLPRSFAFPSPTVSIWYPADVMVEGVSISERFYNVIGRLRPGVSATAAQAELNGLMPRLSDRYPVLTPQMVERSGARVAVQSMQSWLVAPVRSQLVLLGIMVFVVLVIATTNVVILFLLRVERADQEIAIALSLGASRSAIARRFIVEGMVLGAASVVVALPVAVTAVATKLGFTAGQMPRLNEIAFDVRTLIVMLTLALVIGAAVGLMALTRTSVRRLTDRLRASMRATSSPAWRQVQRGLVTFQVAIALALLTAAGLLGRSFWNLRNAKLGFEPEAATMFEVALPFRGYSSYGEAVAFHTRVTDRLRTLPGVEAAASAGHLPLADEGAPEMALRFEATDRATPEPVSSRVNFASAEYFSVMRIPVRRGRSFMPGDLRGTPGIVLSEGLARALFGSDDPVGRQVRRAPGPGLKPRLFQVIGVVGDVHGSRIEEGYPPTAYLPILRDGDGVPKDSFPLGFIPRGAQYVVRGTNPPSAATIRQLIREADRRVPAVRIQPVMSLVDAATARVRLTLLLLGVAGGAALLLGVVGVYSVVSYAAAGRMREFAVRLALGATPKRVASAVLTEGASVGVAGVAVGVLLAWIGTRFLSSLLYEVSATSTLEFALAAAVLLGLTLSATLIPARRASRTDPATVLRGE